jgi:hypothetical protein
MRFGVALHKTGEYRWSLWWHCTRLRVQVRFGVALYKTRKYIWDLVWHCTRLEILGEVWFGSILDWRIQVRFDVALKKTGKYRRDLVWHSKGIQSRNKFSLPKRVVNRSCPASFTPYSWNAYPMNSVFKLISAYFRLIQLHVWWFWASHRRDFSTDLHVKTEVHHLREFILA